MRFHVLTLFPQMILDGLNTSITGRAIQNGILSVDAVNIRDFAENKYMKVDDYPYGGGAGLVMQPGPVCSAYKSVTERIGKKPRVVYMTPQGYPFTQQMAQEFAQEEDLCILCGHYEGIDERALEKIVTDYVSIGDYVLTGGELPAMVVIDAVSRLVPGVLNNKESAETESFENGLLEYPQYTRPVEFEGMRVPDILLSGHHGNVDAWRLEKSVERTKKYRPDLYEAYVKEQESLQVILDQKQAEYDDYSSQLARAKQEAAVYMANVRKQNDEIKRLQKESDQKQYCTDRTEDSCHTCPAEFCNKVVAVVVDE